MFNVLSKAEMEMKRSSLPQILFEMAVLRLTDIRPFQEIDALIEKINRMEGDSSPPIRGEAPPAKKAGAAPAQPAPKRQDPVEPPDPNPQASQPAAGNNAWQKIRSAAGSIKRPLGTYLDNCRLASLDASEMCLSFPDPYTMGLVEKEENLEALKAAVAQVCGQPDIKITLQLVAASPAPAENAAAADEPAPPKGKGQAKKGSASEEEILKDALDVFGGIVIR